MAPLSRERALAILRECQDDIDDTEESQVTIQDLCRLWAGAGYVYKISISSPRDVSIIVKHIVLPNQRSFGDKRKAKSYEIEANFYEKVAGHLVDDLGIRIPRPLNVSRGPQPGEMTIAMSVMDGSSSIDDFKVMEWLAEFHAAKWGIKVDELVEKGLVHAIGSYWYLDTRPDEYENMSKRGWECRLKRAAKAIDQAMQRDPMQCLIHGDAKDANILTLKDGRVGMYDFQYCGKSPPTRDLAYFLCSSSNEDEDALLRHYYDHLVQRLSESEHPSFEHLIDSLELAYCDYYRFMAGWGYWGNDISSRVQAFLSRLDKGSDLGSEEEYDQALRRHLW